MKKILLTILCACCLFPGVVYADCDAGWDDDDDGYCDGCDDGYGLVNGSCEPCAETGCVDCYNNINYCEYCDMGYVAKSGRCVSCSDLLDNCSNCEMRNNQPVCNDCKTGYGSYSYGWYNNGSHKVGECVACPENCTTCTGGICKSCESGYVLANGACAKKAASCKIEGCDENYCTENGCGKCKSGYSFAENGTCQPTDDHMANCLQSFFGDPNLCNTCKSGYVTKNGVCITTSECTETQGFYVSNKKYCAPDGCTRIISNYYGRCEACGSMKLQKGVCVSQCGEYYELSSDGKRCDPKNCYWKDASAGLCTQCLPGYYLKGSVCVSSCDTGYIIGKNKSGYDACIPTELGCGYGETLQNNTCVKFTMPENCTAYDNGCTECESGYLTSGGACIAESECKNGLHADNGACVANTDPNCNTENDSVCTECKSGYLTNSAGTCTKTEDCKEEYFVDSEAGACKPIPGCVSFSAGECSCDKGYYKKDGGCVSAEDGCGGDYLEKNGSCISASLGCGNGYKEMGGYCNRVRYTPPEAAAIANDDNTNVVTLTFKK